MIVPGKVEYNTERRDLAASSTRALQVSDCRRHAMVEQLTSAS